MTKTPEKHNLKIASIYFKDMKEGRKDFEIRFDDRDYKVGNILVLHEHRSTKNTALEPTGESISRKVKYVLRKFKGLRDGYLVLGLEKEDS